MGRGGWLFGMTLALLLAFPAWGEDLSGPEVETYKAAKAAGKLREGGRGYLEAGSGADGGLRTLMERVNTLRRERYADLARRQGVPIEAVEATAAARLAGE